MANTALKRASSKPAPRGEQKPLLSVLCKSYGISRADLRRAIASRIDGALGDSTLQYYWDGAYAGNALPHKRIFWGQALRDALRDFGVPDSEINQLFDIEDESETAQLILEIKALNSRIKELCDLLKASQIGGPETPD